jgi:hypothetical protein
MRIKELRVRSLVFIFKSLSKVQGVRSELSGVLLCRLIHYASVPRSSSIQHPYISDSLGKLQRLLLRRCDCLTPDPSLALAFDPMPHLIESGLPVTWC